MIWVGQPPAVPPLPDLKDATRAVVRKKEKAEQCCLLGKASAVTHMAWHGRHVGIIQTQTCNFITTASNMCPQLLLNGVSAGQGMG